MDLEKGHLVLPMEKCDILLCVYEVQRAVTRPDDEVDTLGLTEFFYCWDFKFYFKIYENSISREDI